MTAQRGKHKKYKNSMNTFGPQITEIFESEIVEKHYVTHEWVDTTPVKSSLSQQVYKIES